MVNSDHIEKNKIRWCTQIGHEGREIKSLHVLDRISESNIPFASNIFGYVSHSSWASRVKNFNTETWNYQ